MAENKTTFAKGHPGGPGRPKLGDSTRDKLKKLLGEKRIADALMADFEAGNERIRDFVYQHWYGKPIVRTENDNTHHFPDKINVTFHSVKKPNDA